MCCVVLELLRYAVVVTSLSLQCRYLQQLYGEYQEELIFGPNIQHLKLKIVTRV
jgi:hypothetical protein